MANSDILKLSNYGKTVIGVYDKSVKSITIPDGVTKIRDRAFSDCSSLQSIDIPNSVTEIGEKVFHFCSSLQSINVSKDNMHYASVDGILFNKDLTVIVRFPQKNDVKEYVIPTSVTEIGDWAFYGCSSLQSIDIPDGVTEIRNNAFSGCSSLQSINIPNSVTEIGHSAFSGCSSLQSIDIPDSVTEIGESAFSGCSSLEHIYLHYNEVEKLKVGKNIFEGVNLDKCILHVPSGTRWAYRHHDVFKHFKNIVTTGF